MLMEGKSLCLCTVFCRTKENIGSTNESARIPTGPRTILRFIVVLLGPFGLILIYVYIKLGHDHFHILSTYLFTNYPNIQR
jgi:hypothetical protein